MTAPQTQRPWPGRPHPLGATWDGEGTNVAVYSRGARAVRVCLFDERGRESAVPLEESTLHVWHGYLPRVAPGQRYGLRVDGPYDPGRGLRFDPSRVLLDPYARALCDDGGQPRCVVVHDAFPWGEDVRPQTALGDSVIYELHVKGFTARHPDVPARLRGTYAGLAHPAAVEHLLRLGVTAVELLPVQAFVSEPGLLRRGLTNYWGYNPVGWFAPHAGYSSGGALGEQVGEFKAMVRALHAAGIQVLLDVVYNHTGEGDEHGPTLSLRGLDNPDSYRLDDADPSRYRDDTGCGNTVDVRRPHVLQMVMDSLRYWVTEMHVDGFRFDLAPALARGEHGFDPGSAFFGVIRQDPVLGQVTLIAEPWDLGEGGYRLGQFPPPWAEWNAAYRDTVRDVWRGQAHGVRDLAYRLSGSSDLFQDAGRRPYASVNFVTAHDGFTLRDLTTYDQRRNLANGEDGRDGEAHNRSWSCGVEGETDDPAVNALRLRQARNLLATLLLSTGVPMLSMGDEVRRTQQGNNNAYCQDGPLSWQPWEHTSDAAALNAFVARLVALRRAHPVFRQRSFFSGSTAVDGVKDLAWFGPDGRELAGDGWFDTRARALAMYLSGRTIRTRGPRGEPVVDDSFLLVLHAGANDLTMALPGRPWAGSYEVEVDTAERLAQGSPLRSEVTLTSRSLLLLRVCGAPLRAAPLPAAPLPAAPLPAAPLPAAPLPAAPLPADHGLAQGDTPV